MEVSTITKMLIRMMEDEGVSIHTIVTDDDSNVRSKAWHVANGGELPNHVAELTF
jgi:hypothetical protein